jgi:DNA-binding Lrp family transcriptional regulator
MNLDKKDCLILNILQENSRTSLSAIAKKINLSIDSTKKRINKMLKNEIFYPRIQLRMPNLGYKYTAEVRIKLHSYTNKEYNSFIEFLKKNVYVSEIFIIASDWDLSIVIVAKDKFHFLKITNEIRTLNSKIIKDWAETITNRVIKFETYDAIQLID